MDTNKALDLAIDVIGTQQKLADELGIKPPSIHDWRMRNRVPAERCGDIERVTGGVVTRQMLRPDIFGAPEASRVA